MAPEVPVPNTKGNRTLRAALEQERQKSSFCLSWSPFFSNVTSLLAADVHPVSQQHFRGASSGSRGPAGPAQAAGLVSGIPSTYQHPFGLLEGFYLVPANSRVQIVVYFLKYEFSFIWGHLSTQLSLARGREDRSSFAGQKAPSVLRKEGSGPPRPYGASPAYRPLGAGSRAGERLRARLGGGSVNEAAVMNGTQTPYSGAGTSELGRERSPAPTRRGGARLARRAQELSPHPQVPLLQPASRTPTA